MPNSSTKDDALPPWRLHPPPDPLRHLYLFWHDARSLPEVVSLDELRYSLLRCPHPSEAGVREDPKTLHRAIIRIPRPFSGLHRMRTYHIFVATATELTRRPSAVRHRLSILEPVYHPPLP